MSDQEENFRKFAEAEKRAGENVNPNDLLTKQEIHEFGIDIIYKYAQQQLHHASTNKFLFRLGYLLAF